MAFSVLQHSAQFRSCASIWSRWCVCEQLPDCKDSSSRHRLVPCSKIKFLQIAVYVHLLQSTMQTLEVYVLSVNMQSSITMKPSSTYVVGLRSAMSESSLLAAALATLKTCPQRHAPLQVGQVRDEVVLLFIFFAHSPMKKIRCVLTTEWKIVSSWSSIRIPASVRSFTRSVASHVLCFFRRCI